MYVGVVDVVWSDCLCKDFGDEEEKKDVVC